MAARTFPTLCGACGKIEVRPIKSNYETQFKHDGTLHDLRLEGLEIPTCSSCGARWMGAEQDEKIVQALRDKVGLLRSADIREQRKQLGLTQEQLAERLGVAKESVSRWETGALIQSVSTDRLLRMFFKYPTDPVWGCDVASEPELLTAKLSEMQKWFVSFEWPTQGSSTDKDRCFHEWLDSDERHLLSQLILDESKFNAVESRISEEDFAIPLWRHTYRSMCSLYHSSGHIVPLRLAEVLSKELSDLPIQSRDVLKFLADKAESAAGIEELADLMSRRSRFRRELSESP